MALNHALDVIRAELHRLWKFRYNLNIYIGKLKISFTLNNTTGLKRFTTQPPNLKQAACLSRPWAISVVWDFFKFHLEAIKITGLFKNDICNHLWSVNCFLVTSVTFYMKCYCDKNQGISLSKLRGRRPCLN